MPDTTLQQLEASARRALDALAMLILDNPDPGTEALGAQYELRQALFGQPSESPAIRVWQIQAQRRDGSWNNYSAPIVDEAEAHGDYAETIATSGHTRAFRLVSFVTTQTVEAHHDYAAADQEAKARVADEAPQPETQADEDRCAHGCDVSICPCLACEAEQPATEVETPCTCAAAGDCFAPSGHYADCPQAEQPAVVSQPGKEN